ncbi:hypothetical protein CTAM01_13331 [Colletotrichum tamarilloi]|uniref:Nucleoside phosphorylase domain-containing protein n=1 Tax=Colletotrichum tamarilloi TaxID=1209934 RepID=A0ABQ9QSB4_9PEZI|nr:uncharacterized protein CTAM01_13331 [Colletotrichum tamarilloi]KAK1483574.1 hypothetical protein CTAM01_13331 [Colletotrichum tamarilloi]
MDGKRRGSEDGGCSPSAIPKRQRMLLGKWGGETRRSIDNVPPEYHRYTIAWICALPTELVAAEAMLDEKHDTLPSGAFYGNSYTIDTNTYTLGSIEGHNVIIACLPADQYGTNNAANVVTNLVRTFPSTRLALMVGIGGGVPSSARDIRLGDIVVGTRTMQYDLGKIVAGAEIQRTAIARTLHHSFGKAITVLRAKHDRVPSQVPSILKERFKTLPHYGRPTDADRLFLLNYNHPESAATCDDCDQTKRMTRRTRLDNDPVIHYGAIASGNQVMKNATERDITARSLDVVCFEMEAAGIMDIVPCLPIRGICDYADSHKNKAWQRYAAAAAAACARELLSVLPSADHETRAVPRLEIPRALPDQHQRQAKLLETLKFDQMDSRRSTVKRAHAKTCAWFIKHPDFQTWLNEDELKLHHGLLWIRGKPGAGKSTIMKFALLRMQKDSHWPPLVISFFFNARGEHLERSIEGMYRSLLLQLFQGYPQLRSVLNERYSNQQEYETCPSLEVLKDMFSEAVLSLGQLRLTCFIDALDECDEQQVTDMVRDFEDLAEDASTEGIAFRICFSSRHYPYIVVKRGATMILENQPGHTQDMENYIKNRLRFNNPPLVEELQTEILRKAAGVFLWIVLVVDILNTEYSQGGLALKKRLVEIPSDLGALFKNILTRDSKNTEHLFLCVIWILCAKRPLKPREFYHALWSGLSQSDLVDPDPPNVTSPEDEDSATRCVIGFSKGLAEITKSTQPTVQFIHESVRDYLLKAGGLAELWPDLGFDWELSSHENLKACCIKYIRYYLASGSVSDESLRQFPFMEYASQQVFFHADAAAAGISQLQFLSQFPLENWIRIYNRYEKHRIRRYGPRASLVYIFSEMDCSRLIRTIPSRNWARHSQDRYNYPLFAALANGNCNSVAALFGMPSVIYNGTNIMEGMTHRRDFLDFKQRTPLSWAAQDGRLEMVKLLLRAGYNVNESDYGGYTPLHRAAKQGHESVVKLLIRNGAKIDQTGKCMRTPLYLAVVHRREVIVRILLGYNANANAGSAVNGSSPLYEASKAGWRVDPPEAIVKLLIENGAYVNSRCDSGDTALHAASRAGNERIAKLLIENGAIVNAENYEHRMTALHCVCSAHTVTDILIEERLKERGPLSLSILDTPGESDATLQKIDKVISKLLVEVELNVNSGANRCNSKSKLAPSFSYEEIVRLLVEDNASVEVAKGGRAAHLSDERKHDNHATAKVLLDSGAALDVVDDVGETPLTNAVSAGDRKLLQLLLENGANVDLTGNSYKYTPLILAILLGREDMAIDLIEHGANVNLSKHAGMTPLSAARDAGCSAWLIRLLERLSII